MQPVDSLIDFNFLTSLQTKVKLVLLKMYKFVSFVFAFVLLYLPASNLVQKSLSPCTNKFMVAKKSDAKSKDPLYKTSDEIASRKVKFLEYMGDLKHLERAGWVMNQIPKPVSLLWIKLFISTI